jgi:protocatechuate 3,4-dioxygenase beta subunit
MASTTNRGETTSIITGDDGAFEFNHLLPGKYSLEGAKRGFITSYFEQHERFNTAIVTGGETDSEHLVFRLTPQAIITGKVLDESGEAIRNANVSLYRQDRSSGVTTIAKVAAAQTDDLGTYEFAELARGDYFLAANAKPWYAQHPHMFRAENRTATFTAVSHPLDVAYPTTYYSDVRDSDEATPIPLRGGERLSVDMHLSPVPALRIIFRRLPNNRQSFDVPMLLKREFDSTENITAMLMGQPGDPPSPGGLNFGMVSENELEFSGIPAGKYTVLMPNSSGGSGEGAIVAVDLSRNGQVLDASSGDPLSSVRLAVKISGGGHPPQPIVVVIQNVEHKTVIRAPVDANGQAELLGVPPGSYVVVALTPTGDYYLRGVDTNGTHSASDRLDVPAGSAVEGTISLTAGRTRVEGFAKRAGKGTAGAMIVLVPKDPETNHVMFRRDQSDSDGSFSLPSVIPGEYTIVAIDRGWDLDWSKPAVIAHYAEHGRKISVPEGTQGLVRLSEAVEVQPR